MIRVVGLHKSYNGQKVLDGINFNIEKGEIIALLGESGSGKSVLLRHLIGLEKPDEGKIFIEPKGWASIADVGDKKRQPSIDIVEEMLPSANCGACGVTGCRAFAETVVNEGTNPAKCTVSSPDGITLIAEYL